MPHGSMQTKRLARLFAPILTRPSRENSAQHDFCQRRGPPSKDDLSKNCSPRFFKERAANGAMGNPRPSKWVVGYSEVILQSGSSGRELEELPQAEVHKRVLGNFRSAVASIPRSRLP